MSSFICERCKAEILDSPEFIDEIRKDLIYGQKSLEVLRAMARLVEDEASEKSLTIAPDWGLGSATIIFSNGGHTHIGNTCENEKDALKAFVDGIYGLLVKKCGLSIVEGKK